MPVVRSCRLGLFDPIQLLVPGEAIILRTVLLLGQEDEEEELVARLVPVAIRPNAAAVPETARDVILVLKKGTKKKYWLNK